MPTPEAPTPRRTDTPTATPPPTAEPATEGRRPRSRRTKVLAAGLVLGAAALAVGGVAAATGDDDPTLAGADRDRAAQVAVEQAGGGTVTDAERDDDGGYDVEVRREDGTEVDIDLAEDFSVVGVDRDDPDGRDDDDVTADQGRGDRDDRRTDDGPTGDDRSDDVGRIDDDRTGVDDDAPLTGDVLDRASKAAIAEAGSGTVTDAHVGDDGAAYEVEVTLADGTEVDVDLDAAFTVIRTDVDRPDLDD